MAIKTHSSSSLSIAPRQIFEAHLRIFLNSDKNCNLFLLSVEGTAKHTHTQSHIHTHTQSHTVRTQRLNHFDIKAFSHIHTHTKSHTHTRTHTRTRARAHTCTQSHTHTHTHTHTQSHSHTHTVTHAHTHTHAHCHQHTHFQLPSECTSTQTISSITKRIEKIRTQVSMVLFFQLKLS